MAELDGRVALVTGASRGIGAASARALAAAGARVVATDIEAPDELARAVGGLALALDVTQEDSWIKTLAHVAQEVGGLDILVNNAGLLLVKPATTTTLEEWRRIQSVNVEGVFLGCKHAVPRIAERAGRWPGGGAIVNLSSVAGMGGGPLMSAYCASKGAVRLMTKALALEFAAAKVRVNSVHPGVIDTAMGEDLAKDLALAQGVGGNEAREALVQLHPLGRMGDAKNIADAVTFLASDRAAFITGTELVVDGGMTAR